MPHYDYVCNDCGHRFETFQSMTEDALKECPECGKMALRRLLGTGAGFIFKGSGFYITDYKNKGGEGKGSTTETKPASDKSTSSEKSSSSTKKDTPSKPDKS